MTAAKQFKQAFGFAPPHALVRERNIDGRGGTIFLPPLAKILGAPNAFEAIVAHAVESEATWPVLQILAGLFELSPGRDGQLFVYRDPDGSEHLVTWSFGEGFSSAIATDIDAYLAVERAIADGKNAVAAIAKARSVVDWSLWPASKWIDDLADAGKKVGRVGPLAEDASDAWALIHRARWVSELIVHGKLVKASAPNDDERSCAANVDRVAGFMTSALYWMWRSYFLGEDDQLEALLEATDSSRPRVVLGARETLEALRDAKKPTSLQKRLIAARESFAMAGDRSRVRLGKARSPVESDWSADGAPAKVRDADLVWYACGPAKLCFCLRDHAKGYEAMAGDAKGVTPLKPALVAHEFPYAFTWDGLRVLAVVKGALWEIDLRAHSTRKLEGGPYDAVATSPKGFVVSGKGKVTFHQPGGARIAFPPGELLTVFAAGQIVAYKRKDDESIMLVAVDGATTWYLGTVDPTKQLSSAVHRSHKEAFAENRVTSYPLVNLEVALREARKEHPNGDGVALTKPLARRLVR